VRALVRAPYTPRARATMHYACLVCEKIVDAISAAEVAAHAPPSARSEPDVSTPSTAEKGGLLPFSDAMAAGKYVLPTQQKENKMVARCRVCDGIYHTPCLLETEEVEELKAGATFSCVKCRYQAQKQVGKESKQVDEEVLPILVPALAFPYLRRPRKAAKDGNSTVSRGFSVENEDKTGDSMETADQDWSVFSTAVEVCTTCRQVEVETQERGKCLKCHGARLHRRCVQHQQAEHGPAVKKKIVYRGTGKKRRRAPSTGTLEWCAPCLLQNGRHVKQLVEGSIETRTISILVNEQEDKQKTVQWWKECSVCKGNFCLHEFCDPLATDTSLDEILANAPVDDENDVEWTCGHCRTSIAASSSALVTVVICDGCDGEFDMATLDPPLTEVPDGDWFCHACSAETEAGDNSASSTMSTAQELGTVLICDGCDREFDMASIYPPLSGIPKGDWFCQSCVSDSQTASAATGAGSYTAPLVPVTLLLCDMCDEEFDMKALNPPLDEVPSGDWFCPSCCVSENTKNKVKKQRSTPKAGVSTQRHLTKPPSATPAQEVVVTVLLCDGCDHEFDPLALHPPLLEIPEGEWFCPICSDARKASDAVQTCVGCDTKFSTGGSAADRLHRPSGTVDGVLLCEACRNLQVGYTRRRSIPTVTQDQEAKSLSSTASKKRSRLSGASDGQKKAKKAKPPYNGPPMTEGNAVVTQPPAPHTPSNASTEEIAGPRLLIPPPITMVASSAGLRNEFDGMKGATAWSHMNPTVILADPGDIFAVSSIDDMEESGILIVCDSCFGEFKMTDVLGTDDANAVPARPWFCKPCLRAFKRSRKKSPRFSKQMVLEMQVYGRLLRATAAKVSDIGAVTGFGNPPNSREERRKMYELVGKSVGVFLQWDKQWVMGRVMAFHATHPSMHHTIRFDDGVLASLPLYAFPLVVGTSTLLYVKVPALQNRWWPAQVLRLNTLARNMLLPTHEEQSAARENFRFVRIFARDDDRVETVQYVSCWVPKYLCRSMKRFDPPSLEDQSSTRTMEDVELMFSKSVERARKETQAEMEGRDRVFQALLSGFRRATESSAPQVVEKPVKGSKRAAGRSDPEERIAQVAEALVGKTIEVTSVGSCGQRLSPGTYVVKGFDKESKMHVIVRHDGADMTKFSVDLLHGKDGVAFHLEDASAFSELAVMLELSGSDVGGRIPGEFHSKELLEKAIIRETGQLRDNAALGAANTNGGLQAQAQDTCSYCLLGPDECRDGVDSNALTIDGEEKEELVVCAKCDRRFHSTCCDPPHTPISLVSPEDGEVLVSDLQIPFVCGDCTSCAGCHRSSHNTEGAAAESADQTDKERTSEEDPSPRWSQWRLPLQAAALCAHCIPYYKANRFCGVCNLVLDDEQLATSVDLLSCSTCHHWIHADCEPDPSPAFHAFSDCSDFSLDVATDPSNDEASSLKTGSSTEVPSANLDADSGSISSLKTPVGSRSPSEERELLPNGKNPAVRDDGGLKTAKQVEDDFAHTLRFEAAYDPKVLHNYECLTCRKVRMLHVLHRLGVEDKLDLFKEPVTEAIAPTYFAIIKSPIDLSTMRQKILDGKYMRVNFRAFRDDFELMCLNAVTFNSKERDFLIWREAWRFYGQGQRIFRQTAPKARMKQRGGRHYDALLVAAKRQLPNNSSLAGKPQSNGDSHEARQNGDGGDHDEEEDFDDDEEGDAGSDTGSDRALSHQENGGTSSALASEVASVNDSDTNSTAADPTGQSQHGEASSDVLPTGSANGTSLVVSTALAERRIVTNDAFVFQTKLRSATLTTRVALFQIVETRTSAHTYCWLDMCAVCGSAGLQRDFIFCVDCGEGFHSFCVPGISATRLEDNEQMRAYWRCPNCKMCEICGQPGAVCGADSPGRVVVTAGNVDSPAPTALTGGAEADSSLGLANREPLLVCAHCDRGFHGSCLVPAIKVLSRRRDGASVPLIYCASCVACTNCKGTTEFLHSAEAEKDHVAALECTYSYEQDKCLHCHNRKEREAQALKDQTRLLTDVWTSAARKSKKDAEKCPLCRRKWDADLEELMQCDACERWVHPPCDALLKADPRRYQTLVRDPNAVYVCAACRPQEREHLSGTVPDGEGWRCQVLIADIQRKRLQCVSGWKETHVQLGQIERWKQLAEHTPVYLYVLRLGEECLRNFAYRSLNFQSDWYRFTKQQELDATGVTLPEWLLRKANRYMRFKRYVRGPRAAARRRERKTQSFYSKQGVGSNTQKDASAICTIVSEAASCAALLACVHLLYGWRPLPEVVLHLLASDDEGVAGSEHRRLGEPLLKRLRTGESVDGAEFKPRLKLEEEIAAIKEQYDRRVAKKHLVHEPASDLSLFGVRDGASGSSTTEPAPDTALAKKDGSDAPRPASKTPTPAKSSLEIATDLVAASDARASPHPRAVLAYMTTAPPLHGWPAKTSEGEHAVDIDESSAPATFDDGRFCALCFMIGDNTACGRLLYTESETWVHVNCALWSMEVYEDASGVLHRCNKAKHRSRLVRCDACGLMGATIGCAIGRCTTHYHFPCAVDAGVAFLPNGETCCPLPSHLDIVARRLQATSGVPLALAAPPQSAESMTEDEPQPAIEESKDASAASADEGDVSSSMGIDENESAGTAGEEEGKEQASAGDASNASGSAATSDADAPSVGDRKEVVAAEAHVKQEHEDSAVQQVTSSGEPVSVQAEAEAAAPTQSQYVLPVINPRPEPRRSLFSDPPLVSVSDMKKKKRAELKRGIKPRPMCYRVGALTVHSLGHIFVGNESFHTRTIIYPLGFRSTRIFWSTQHLATRCLYECVISSTEIEERRARRQKGKESGDDDGAYDQQRQRPSVVFKITASDDQERPIVASTPEDALIELRSRVVSLYEEHRIFSATPRVSKRSNGSDAVETERNPLLKRSSWFSFALTGDYFFGFGLPEISQHIENLPYAATTAVSRRAIVRKLRQQQQRQGQSPLAGSAAATWGSGSRKRSHDELERSAAAALAFALEDDREDEPYEFIQVLPSAETFQTAERVMEQLVRAEQRARQSSGCVRTDGFEGNRLFGTPKKAKIMPRRQALNKVASNEPFAAAANGGTGSGNTGGVAMDIEHLPITMQYRELRRRPFDERMLVRKSSIHGYGLFLKEAVAEGQMIVEYQGQMIGQAVADERERRYEEQGVGSCYMFRLDEKMIIDATRTGNLARFINHSCDPKAFARIVTVEGGEKKIVIFAKRAIAVGDEVTYDYKFPIEDEAIRCDCNAPNCIGRMN
jgi:hypothetical protein